MMMAVRLVPGLYVSVSVYAWLLCAAAVVGQGLTPALSAGDLSLDPAARAAVTKVHVVQSNHLDVGFCDGSSNEGYGLIPAVLNNYFEHHLPLAINTSRALRQRGGGGAQLVFTTHAYVVSLFLDCPARPGLRCPGPAAVSSVEQALRDGVIVLHVSHDLACMLGRCQHPRMIMRPPEPGKTTTFQQTPFKNGALFRRVTVGLPLQL